MVLEKQCHTIVMLNKCKETQKEYLKYWPDVDNHSVYRDTTVLTVSEVANGNIITRKIKVTTNKVGLDLDQSNQGSSPPKENTLDAYL